MSSDRQNLTRADIEKEIELGRKNPMSPQFRRTGIYLPVTPPPPAKGRHADEPEGKLADLRLGRFLKSMSTDSVINGRDAHLALAWDSSGPPEPCLEPYEDVTETLGSVDMSGCER